MEKKIAVKNSVAGLINQCVIILIEFLIRSVTIRYLGIEIVGLNSTFTSILYTLSLADLGFQSAIVFSLYRPLHDNDTDTVNDLINIIKTVYRGIGLFIFIASFAVLPFLKYILTGIDIYNGIYIMFILQALSSVATYFMAYKRTLLYADRKAYMAQIVDIVTFAIFGILEVAVIVCWSNYYAYLILKIIRVLLSNIIIHVMGSSGYPYLKSLPVKRPLLKKVFIDVKDVFAGRIAGYVYSSTDSLVISTFISTVAVGFYTNYTMIIEGLRLMTNALTQPVIPSIGNFLIREKGRERRIAYFYEYSHIRYLIAVFIVIPAALLIDEFITMWVGADYVLSDLFVALISIELYIHIVHSSTYDYIQALGLFRKDKYIELAGAITNIVISIILAKYWGIEGVITGTVIAQMVFWIGRSYLVFLDGFGATVMQYMKYWIRNIIYIVLILTTFCIDRYIVGYIRMDHGLLHFCISAVTIEVVSLLVIAILLIPMNEQKQVMSFVIRQIKNRKNG